MEDSGDAGDDLGNAEQEYEVEDILKYRKDTDGEEYFLVKWVGFPVDEATWEPLVHMNDNCKELIVKARALFAWRRPVQAEPDEDTAGGTVDAAAEGESDGDEVAGDGVGPDLEPVPDDPAVDDNVAEVDVQLPTETEKDNNGEQRQFEDGGIVVDDGDDDEPEANGEQQPQADVFKRKDFAAGSVGAADTAPSKRPKLQAPPFAPGGTPGPSDSAVTSQSKRPTGSTSTKPHSVLRPGPKSSTPTPPAGSLSQKGDAASGDILSEEPEPFSVKKPPVAREMKCICGATEKVSNSDRKNLVVCRICSCGLHPGCVEGSINGQVPDPYVCPPCRLERVDEFHPPVGAGVLRHSYASASSTFTLSFTSQAATWKKQQWAVHLRAVALGSADLSGPAWPHKVQGKLNGRQCVAIDPPKHLHVRREQCYNLTPLLRPGMNQLELRFIPKPDRARDEQDESYCVGVVLTRPRSVASIIARIRTRSTETVNSGQQRVRRLLSQVARKERNEEDCTVTGNFGRTLKPLCPVSLCPIEESAIGRHCNHIQVFDLQAYIAVNQRMRSLDKRWTCPVCSLALRPDDIVLDPFAQGILDTLRGDEDLVEAIVFNENCTWSTISALKDKDEKDGRIAAAGDDEGEKAEAELIDLSDSE